MTATPRARLTCDVPVFYATTEGQTQRIATRLAFALRRHGVDSVAIDLSAPVATDVDWSRVRGALVGTSIHAQRHHRAAAAFVKAHASALNAHPSAFFSVSLS